MQRKQLDDVLDFVVFRAVGSLLKCRAQGSSDIAFKSITGINLIKKAFNNVPEKVRVDFTPWIFGYTIVKVNFRGITYKFGCPSQSDSNIFLNPYYHEYDVPVLISRILEKGDTFVDVGAHCGLYTLLAGKIIGDNGQVVAVEPNPENIELLRANVRLNGLANVTVIPQAASDRLSVMDVYYERGKTAFTSALRRIGCKARVQTIRLDDISRSLNSIKLLKIDTEGCDMQVLEGAQATLAKTDYIVVEQTHKDIRELLLKRGFRLFLLTASKNLLAIKGKVHQSRVLSKIASSVEDV